MSDSQEHSGLRLLSLDGGGIRGLSELLILRHIMDRIQSQEKLKETPLPCEYFDLIGGTSTGGIIALMLGRLRMSVTKAIECYGVLAETVFSDVKSLGGDGKFKASKLEEVIKTVVKEQTGQADERMMDPRPHDQCCKTFVCAMAALDMSAGIPRLFRTYQSPENQSFDCTIWEAARATSAAPTFFKRIVIGGKGSSEPYVDGGLGCNNPISQILEEAALIFPDRHVACIISIGTGHAQTIRIPKPGLFQRILPLDVVQAMRGIATDCERSAQEIARRFQDLPTIYFRFNVEQGLQDVGLAQWERLDEVTAHTEQYIRMTEPGKKLNNAILAICERKNVVATAHISGTVRSSVLQRPSLKRCPPPTPVFTGRQDILDQMSDYFSNDLGKQRVFVLHGLGGAGKSQIAFKFIEMCQAGTVASRFSDVFFVDASTAETTNAELKNIAHAEGIGQSATDTLNWLATQHDDYFPRCSHGNVLITSRNRDVLLHASGPRSHCQVSGMKPHEAKNLLLELAALQEELTEEADLLATTIVKELGHLALAVIQAGAYISRSECGLRRYLNIYQQRRERLLEVYRDDVQKIDDYKWTVYTAWRISYDRLSKPAVAFLEFCAFLHHDGISEAIFQKAASNFPIESPVADKEPDSTRKAKDFLSLFRTGGGSFDVLEFLKIINEVRSYSLIDFVEVNQTYSIHPLVHAWTRTMISNPDVTRDSVQWMLAISIGTHGGVSSEDHAFRRTLLTHLDTVLENGIAAEVKHCKTFGLVYKEGGRWKDAEKLDIQVNDTSLKVLGPDHPDTLTRMGDLALTYRNQGRWKEAEELQVQVKDASLRLLGPEHPSTLTSLGNLAVTYGEQGQWKEAEELEVQVMDARLRLLGPEHPSTLKSMGNLAVAYREQGQWKDAEKLEVRVKDASLRLLGPEHPDTLTRMGNLAVTYRGRGQWKEAEELQVQVKDASLRLLGLEHPITLRSMGNLAVTYQGQGEWNEAEELQVQVMNASLRFLGPEHPDTVTSMENLAVTHVNQGQWKQAEELWVQVVDVRKRLLGLDHPHTLDSIAGLASMYRRQGRLKEAEDLRVHGNEEESLQK